MKKENGLSTLPQHKCSAPFGLIGLLLLLLLSASCASNLAASSTVTTSPTYMTRDVATCFYDFTEVYEKRIHRVLSSAPGASDVRRIGTGGRDSSKLICYELQYEKSLDELGAWLKENLRTSQVLPFRLVQKGDNRLEAWFHGGFE